ncbi:MAG: hypothetical protein AAF368_00090 [Planctomycetota bacterium]
MPPRYEQVFRKYLSRRLDEALIHADRDELCETCCLTKNQLSSYLNGSSQPHVPGLLAIVDGLSGYGIEFDIRIAAGMVEDPEEKCRQEALAMLSPEQRRALRLE